MKRLIFIFAILFTLTPSVLADDGFTVSNTGTVKKERNFVKEGNKQFADSNFVKALEYYNKALAVSEGGSPDLLLYNIATARFAQAKKMQATSNSGQPDSTVQKLFASSDSIYNLVIKGNGNPEIREYSAYNAGNLAYNQEAYAKSIDYYKVALRLNPSNDKARQNLRLAQLKLQQQDNGGGGENQEENQEQEQEQQQQQQQQEQQQQQQPKISEQNADQVLKAMENAEQAVRRRHDQNKDARQVPVNPAVLDKPW